MVSRGITLALDAAASIGTVAVLRDGRLVAERTVEMRADGEERYFPAVLDALRDAGSSPRELARVVCGAGPGSFTSLRVAGAIAKGLALGSGCPLLGVPSLALIVTAAPETTRPGSRWLATLDAMRGDRYAALVEIGDDGQVAAVEALGLFAVPALEAVAAERRARRIGPDEALAATPHARGLARCLGLVDRFGPAELASWEPTYGRLAEAQVRWEAAHGRPLPADRPAPP